MVRRQVRRSKPTEITLFAAAGAYRPARGAVRICRLGQSDGFRAVHYRSHRDLDRDTLHHCGLQTGAGCERPALVSHVSDHAAATLGVVVLTALGTSAPMLAVFAVALYCVPWAVVSLTRQGRHLSGTTGQMPGLLRAI